MNKKELERRSYSFDISAEVGLFDEVIMLGAFDNTDLKEEKL